MNPDTPIINSKYLFQENEVSPVYISFRAFIPRFETCSAQIHSIEYHLQGFGREFNPLLIRATRSGPTEAAFFKPFCRNPKPCSIEVEKLDTVAPFVNEDKKRIAAESLVFEVLAGNVEKAIEGFAHVAGLK